MKTKLYRWFYVQDDLGPRGKHKWNDTVQMIYTSFCLASVFCTCGITKVKPITN